MLMASAGLLALLDDITSLLDDVATMTKVATKKTAGVIGDDLALNANQLTGACASRELPIVTAVALGSLLNKAILIPAALLITALAPALITPLLMLGGAFLCFEGAEKTIHKLSHPKHRPSPTSLALTENSAEHEKQRIKGAIRTDFILSAEILVIALGTAAGSSLAAQALTLCVIGLGMTVIVYGSVALIIKADDAGLLLQQIKGDNLLSKLARTAGRGIILGAPKAMKLLSIVGTAAMFLVGGEILAHGIPAIEHTISSGILGINQYVPRSLAPLSGLVKLLAPALLGMFTGLILVAVVSAVRKLIRS
jgi:predicted DNA repair protein MutK